ncbi:MAG: rubredoxin [Acidobacteriales bacterium]|nr:rubredoxin [Terriglobales bacterium]
MRQFKCSVCGFVYDPAKGLPEEGIPPGTPFEALPPDFRCPVCGASREEFSPIEMSGGEKVDAPVHSQATVQEVIPRTPSIKSFRLAIPNYVKFRPGQYLSISLEQQVDLTRYLSISSSPTEEGYLEVTKRITQSRFSQILNHVEPGYRVSITYPMGRFTFEGEFQKIAMLSGGIGITPLRSICRYAADTQLDTSISLLYSNRDLEEVAFKSEFDAMQQANPRFKVVHTLSRAGDDWAGRRGRIDAALVREEVPDYNERLFYVCGPPQMVDALVQMLRSELQVPEARIKTEGFLGY